MRRPFSRLRCQFALRNREKDCEAYVFSQEVRLIIRVNEDAGVTALVSERLFAAQVCVLPADRAAGCDADFSFFVVTAVDVHPHDILVGGFIVDDLWTLDDAVWACVAGHSPGKESAFVGPFYEVGRGVAVDVDE